MMSTTLNLVDYLLNRGRSFQHLGRTHDALRILSQLAGFRELPTAVIEETQFRLGELQLRRRRYLRARRHFAAALRYDPGNARYHFRMAQALDTEHDGDPARALQHYQTSLDLDPQQTDCLCAQGLLALRLGQTQVGLRSLRAAVELAPDDLKVLPRVVTALHWPIDPTRPGACCWPLVFAILTMGVTRKMWNDFQFHAARREQDAVRQQRNALGQDEEEPMLLPFVRPSGGRDRLSRARGRIIRHDGPASPAPHQGQPIQRPDQRHAQ